MSSQSSNPKVAIIMGSASDHDTMKAARDILKDFNIDVEYKVASAHRSPDVVAEFAKSAEANGIRVIIAGAGGAAHLPGVVAAQTVIPVIGVPIQTQVMGGLDSLLSIVQMPGGIPVPTVAIGKAGAKNAALTAVAILALDNPELSERLKDFRVKQSEKALNAPLPD